VVWRVWCGVATRYELVAILTHKGQNADGGHYVAWVQHKDDTWVCFDDDKVTECRQVHSNATCLALPACAKFFARES
jgi:uncharacterized UBP type Zn finger protein